MENTHDQTPHGKSKRTRHTKQLKAKDVRSSLNSDSTGLYESIFGKNPLLFLDLDASQYTEE